MALIWAACGGFLKELFQHTGDLVFRTKERGEAVLSNPHAAQDAVCAGHRDRDTDFVFCALRNGEATCRACTQSKYEFRRDSTGAAARIEHQGAPATWHQRFPLSVKSVSRIDRLRAAFDRADRSQSNAVARRQFRPWTRCAGSEVCEFSSYPAGLDDVPKMLERSYDVVIIDLDSDPEYALELVESIGSEGVATVMVYSASCRSGAPGALHARRRARVSDASACARGDGGGAGAGGGAAAGRSGARRRPRASCWRFWAPRAAPARPCWPAILPWRWPRNRSQKTLLIDLDLPLGDAALNLGIVAEFSTIDALAGG